MTDSQYLTYVIFRIILYNGKEGMVMSKVLENKKQKKDAIMKSAYDLFVANGVNKTSVDDITKRAGIAKGTFYLYFADKYEVRDCLITAYAKKVFDLAIKEADPGRFKTLPDKIMHIMDYIADYLYMHKDITRFIAKNLSWALFKKTLLDSPGERSENNEFNELYNEIISSSREKVRDPQILLFLIVELIGSTCTSVILEEEPASFEVYKPYLNAAIESIIKSQIEI